MSVHGGNRLGANSLLDTLIFGRRSGEHAAAARAQMSMPSPRSRRSLDDERTEIDAIMRREHGGRRVSEIKDELGAMMNEKCAVFRDEDGPHRGARDRSRGSRRRPRPPAIDDRGTVFNQDVLGAIELGYMLDCAECDRRRRARAQGVARRAVPHSTSPSATTSKWLKHIDLTLNGAGRAEVSYSAGDDHQVGARGEDVLGFASHARVHPQDPPLHARSPARPRTGRSSRSTSTATARCSTAILQAKDREDGSIGIRCSCRAAICGSCGVRINGKPALACHTHLDEAPGARAGPPDEGSEPRSPSSRWATCRCSRT